MRTSKPCAISYESVADGTMVVDFWLTYDGRELSSSDAQERALDLGEEWTATWDLVGGLRLVDEEEDLRIDWPDTVVPQFGQLLEALADLGRTGHGRASRTDEYGYLRMDAEGHWIRLGGDDIPSVRVEREAFTHGIFHATRRLLELLQALGLDGFEARHLREDRSTAIQALQVGDPLADGRPELPPLGPSGPRHEADGPVVWLDEGGFMCDGIDVRLSDFPTWAPIIQTRVVPALLAEQSVVASRPDAYGYVRFDVEGDRVRVSGDGLPDVRMPLNGLLRAFPEPLRGPAA